jgi:hypothetical protein
MATVKLAVFLLKLLVSWEWLHFGITCYVIIINFPVSCIDLCSNFIKAIPYILNGLHTSNQSLMSVDLVSFGMIRYIWIKMY